MYCLRYGVKKLFFFSCTQLVASSHVWLNTSEMKYKVFLVDNLSRSHPEISTSFKSLQLPQLFTQRSLASRVSKIKMSERREKVLALAQVDNFQGSFGEAVASEPV